MASVSELRLLWVCGAPQEVGRGLGRFGLQSLTCGVTCAGLRLGWLGSWAVNEGFVGSGLLGFRVRWSLGVWGFLQGLASRRLSERGLVFTVDYIGFEVWV